MQTITDRELVARTLSGDSPAFGELVRRYQGLVYGLALSRISNFADAQDLAQDAFVAAFRKLGQLKDPERFGAWLKSIALNECRMWARGRTPTVPISEELPAPSQERDSEVRLALSRLPDSSRLVLTLHYLSGLSYREIGEFLGVGESAVAQRLHRARGRLKQLLMSNIEEACAMNRLPEGFAEEVLERVSLHPILKGYFLTHDEGGDVVGCTMGIGKDAEKASLVTLWMKREDWDEVALGTIPGRHTETPRGRAFESALTILSASGISMERVVLRLSGDRRCVADLHLKQGRRGFRASIRPSDALGLAVRSGVPICAESPVVEKGNVGEDDVPAPDHGIDSQAYRTEVGVIQRQVDELRAKAWDLGLSPQQMVDTVRYRKKNGKLRMWLEARPEAECSFDADEYAPGIERLFSMAAQGQVSQELRGGTEYGVSFSMLGEDARVRVVPQAISRAWGPAAMPGTQALQEEDRPDSEK